MYCKSCGNKLKENTKFCNKCGVPVEAKKNNAYGIVSLVLGFISLLLCFTINITIIPLAIVGLVFGLACKEKCTERKAGIIINIVSIVISIIIFIVLLVVIFLGVLSVRDMKENLDIHGSWSCKVNDSSSYNVTLNLNENKSFSLSPIGEEYSSAVFGEYMYVGNVLTLFGRGSVNGGLPGDEEGVLILDVKGSDNHLVLSSTNKNLEYVCDR